MNAISRRIVATAALLAAPALIALGTATASQAATSSTDNGPSISTPVHHLVGGSAFPHQHDIPQPGTSVPHHHQHAR